MRSAEFKEAILFENGNYIVINKPAKVYSLDERTEKGVSIIRLAKQYDPEAQLCHRLDFETSGALLIARNPEAYRSAAMQFERRQVAKTYHAIVEGLHVFENTKVDFPLSTSKSGNVRVDTLEGKEALTYFNSLRYFRSFTLVACKPVTGRLHQIRVHLATQRAAIAGDIAYGGHLPFLSKLKRKFNLKKDEEEKPMFNRFALHSAELKFKDLDDSEIVVQAPYYKDMEVFVKLLEKYDL